MALVSRHFFTSSRGLSFGVMHSVMADFLRNVSAELEPDLLVIACRALLQTMTPDRCRNPREWPLMDPFRPHAEVLLSRAFNRDATTILSGDVGLVAALLASAQGDRSFQLDRETSLVFT